MSSAEPVGVVGYRLSTVEPDGCLRGLWGARWPTDTTIEARHEPNPLANDRVTGAFAGALSALRGWEKSVAGGVAIVAVATICVAAGASPVTATSVAVVPPLLMWVWAKILGRRGRPAVEAWALLVQIGLIGLAICYLVAAVRSAMADAWRYAGVALAWATVWAAVATGARYLFRRYGPQWHFTHVGVPCPGTWADHCGIYAYADLARCAREFRRTISADPLAVVQVQLWGRVFQHTDGWRGQYARIEAVYDLDDGHGEASAALYRVPLRAAPVELSAAAARRAHRPPTWLERLCGRLERFAATRTNNKE